VIRLPAEPPMDPRFAAIHARHARPEAVVAHEAFDPPPTDACALSCQGPLDPRTPEVPPRRSKIARMSSSNARSCLRRALTGRRRHAENPARVTTNNRQRRVTPNRCRASSMNAKTSAFVRR
jgi:hypothetical protein